MKGDVIQYRKGYKYSLWEDYRVQLRFIRGYGVRHHLFALDGDGWLTIFADYPWDGATGALDTHTIMRGSLVHDVLYEMLRLGLLPHDPCFHLANHELLNICDEDLMWSVRATYVFEAVEALGSAAAKIRPEKVVTAPRIIELIRET